MTYAELLAELQSLPVERLQDTVTVYEPYDDEYIPVSDFRESDTDVLDEGHFIIVLKA